MEYIAIAKNIKIAPRKMRLVVDSVKKQKLGYALTALSGMKKRGAVPLKKTLDSAVANAANNFNADKNSLQIKDITITEGTTMKRYHYAARGRVRPYKRRTSHIRVILTDGKKNEAPIIKQSEVKQIEAKNIEAKEEKGE